MTEGQRLLLLSFFSLPLLIPPCVKLRGFWGQSPHVQSIRSTIYLLPVSTAPDRDPARRGTKLGPFSLSARA